MRILLFLTFICLSHAALAEERFPEEFRRLDEMTKTGAISKEVSEVTKRSLLKNESIEGQNLGNAMRGLASIRPELAQQKLIRVKNPPLKVSLD